MEFVTFAAASGSSKNKRKGTKATTNAVSTDDAIAGRPETNKRRSKRGASKKATDNLPAIIEAQEEYMKGTKTGYNKWSSSFSVVPISVYDTDKHERGSNSNSKGNAKKRKTSQKVKRGKISSSFSVGRRLSDGKTVASASRKRRQGIGGGDGGDGTTDISVALLGAINDKTRIGNVLRKGMSNSVQTNYETSRAFSRLASIQARSYQLVEVGSCRDVLKVTFCGTVDRHEVEETVDCIQRNILINVLESIHASNREALRPENLSRLSQRVLWSLVRYYPSLTNIADMYRELLPDLDWKFLRRRKEQLSEKALENKRQAAGTENEVDLEEASKAIGAVEHAIKNTKGWQREAKISLQSKVAEARLKQYQKKKADDTIPWLLITPSEPDRDELYACIKSSLPPNSSNTQITAWISKLMKDEALHNWRELSNVQNASMLAENLRVEKVYVQKWIDFAQNKSLSEIMIEICDLEIEAVECLVIKAKCGTPKDLANWRSIPDFLIAQLQKTTEGTNEKDHIGNNQKWMNLSTLSKWSQRAHRSLETFEWLNWYATPVD